MLPILSLLQVAVMALLAVLSTLPMTTYAAGFGSNKVIKQGNIATLKTIVTDTAICPCHSKDKVYSECCQIPHKRTYAVTPTQLIESRFTAFATGDTDYIITTTATSSSDYSTFMELPTSSINGLSKWKKTIEKNMMTNYKYIRMEVIRVDETATHADVTYRFLAIDTSKDYQFPIQEIVRAIKEDHVVDAVGSGGSTTVSKWMFESSQVLRPSPESIAEMATWNKVDGVA